MKNLLHLLKISIYYTAITTYSCECNYLLILGYYVAFEITVLFRSVQ